MILLPALCSAQQSTVRVNTNLVEVDVIVTDSKGNLVKNLTAKDFEVYEDGKRQTITNFSYIETNKQFNKVSPTVNTNIELLTTPLNQETVGIKTVLVVDDLMLSRESSIFVRQALKKYVDQEMKPGEQVSIIKTSVGGVNEFTNNKKVLHELIEKVHWNPLGRAGVSAVDPIEFVAEERVTPSQDFVDFEKDFYTVSTLTTLYNLTEELKKFAGKKAVVILSDGFDIADANTLRTRDTYRRLISAANKNSVSFYSIDARGVQTLSLKAEDDTGQLALASTGVGFDLKSQNSLDIFRQRSQAFQSKQDGLIALANATGGFAIRNNNDLSGGLHEVMKDLRSYYLIAYSPDKEPTATGTFRSIKVRAKRSGLQIRHRTGYLEAAEDINPTSSDINIKLNNHFSHSNNTSHLDSLITIDPQNLSFAETQDQLTAGLLIGLEVVDSGGEIVERVAKNIDLKLTQAEYQEAKEKGFVFPLQTSISKPGFYQTRGFVKEKETGKVARVSQSIQIPDLTKDGLTMSGLTIFSGNGAPSISRKFKIGEEIEIKYELYNQKAASEEVKLKTQMLLYHNGELVYTEPSETVELQVTDTQKIPLSKKIKLGKKMVTGTYLIQIVAKDEKSISLDTAPTTQSIEIEVTDETR